MVMDHHARWKSQKGKGETKIHGYQQEPAGMDIDRYAAGE